MKEIEKDCKHYRNEDGCVWCEEYGNVFDCETCSVKTKTCTICGRKYDGYGNNPWPIKNFCRCCDKCNNEIVVPKRIELLLK